MKFGLRYCNTGRYIDPALAVELVQAGEEAGFESAWTVEHTVVPEGYQSAYPYSDDGKMAGGQDDVPLPDPLIWMAYVAAATTSIKLATGYPDPAAAQSGDHGQTGGHPGSYVRRARAVGHRRRLDA